MTVSRVVLLTAALAGPISAAWADIGVGLGRDPLALTSPVVQTASVVDLKPVLAVSEAGPLPSVTVDSLASALTPVLTPASDPLRSDPVLNTGLMGHWADAPSTGLDATASAASETAVRELPQLPGSASLFLSAILSVGAWQAVRRASHLHIAHLPEWYHPDAPHQIGHSVAFDPTLGFELLAVCVFDAPIEADCSAFLGYPRDSLSRCASQHFLTIESPRAPPAYS